jgi:hypothetical protein
MRVLLLIRKELSVSILFLSLLLCVLPFYESYFPGDDHESEGWKTGYLFSDIFLTIFFVLYFISWLIYLRSKKLKTKKVFSIVLVAFSVLQLFEVVGAAMPVPDFAPSYGYGIVFLLALSTICYFTINRFISRKSKMPASIKDVFTY